VIQLSGELDIATADYLPRFVAALRPRTVGRFTSTLADLAFVDAAGLTALVRSSVVVKGTLRADDNRPSAAAAPAGSSS
jgi:ABC-type transporter Mla MlaB component